MRNNTLFVTLSTCGTWSEMLDVLECRRQDDPDVLAVLATLGEYIGKRIAYYSGPELVRYEGELVEGWGYDLYVDGKRVASRQEC